MGWGKSREAEAGLLGLLYNFPFSYTNTIAAHQYSPFFGCKQSGST